MEINKTERLRKTLHGLKNYLTCRSHNTLRLSDQGERREVIYREKGGASLGISRERWEPHRRENWHQKTGFHPQNTRRAVGAQ